MRKKILILILIGLFEECGESKSLLIDQYLNATQAKAGMADIQTLFVQKLPSDIPSPIKLKLVAFSRRIWDFEDYVATLRQSIVPEEVLTAMKARVAFGQTETGKSLDRSLRNFYENSEKLLSTKKPSDFPLRRVRYFEDKFINEDNPAKSMRVSRDLNFRMIKIFWILRHPGKSPDDADILTRAGQVVAEEQKRNAELRRKKTAPDSFLLRNLLQIMLLTDAEFEAYVAHVNSEQMVNLSKFMFDFDHAHTIARMDKYMKSL